MSNQDHAEVFDQLRRVIGWEMDAQASVERPVEQLPLLIADAILDFFEVSLKAGADVSGLA